MAVISRGQKLHGEIQRMFFGEELADCARAISLSLAATAGLSTGTIEKAEGLIELLAELAKQDLHEYWGMISEARGQFMPPETPNTVQ